MPSASGQVVLGLVTGLDLVGVGIGMTVQGPWKWAVVLPFAALTLLGIYLLAKVA